MLDIKTMNHNFATIGNGVLLIWWGIVIMLEPLTIGMGAIGTGLIMLGVNAARLLTGIPAKSSTTVIGALVLLWGVIDTVIRPGMDVSIALIMILVGLAVIGSLLTHPE